MIAPEPHNFELVAAEENAGDTGAPADGQAPVSSREFDAQAAADPQRFCRSVAARSLAIYGTLIAAGVVLPLLAAGLLFLGKQSGNLVAGLLACFVMFHAVEFSFLVVRAIGTTKNEDLETIGIAVTAPQFIELVESVRTTLGAPPIDAVSIFGEFNARAIQRPPQGTGGRWRNELAFGMPLLCALSRDELKCVIAHEVAHIAGGHAKFSYRIWRQQRMWRAFVRLLDSSSIPGRSLIRRLIAQADWDFEIRDAALSRYQEYEADAAEVAVADRATARNAHMRIAIGDSFTDEYWHTCWSEGPAVPDAAQAEPYRRLAGLLPNSVAWHGAKAALEAELEHLKGAWHSHPTVAERIAAIRATPTVPAPVIEPASRLLGADLDKALSQLDDEWREKNAELLLKHRSRRAHLAALARHSAKARRRGENGQQSELPLG